MRTATVVGPGVLCADRGPLLGCLSGAGDSRSGVGSRPRCRRTEGLGSRFSFRFRTGSSRKSPSGSASASSCVHSLSSGFWSRSAWAASSSRHRCPWGEPCKDWCASWSRVSSSACRSSTRSSATYTASRSAPTSTEATDARPRDPGRPDRLGALGPPLGTRMR